MQGDPPGDPTAASGARAGLSAHPRKSPAEPHPPDGTAAPQVSRLASRTMGYFSAAGFADSTLQADITPLEFWGLFLNWLHDSNTLINNPGDATLKHFRMHFRLIRMTSHPSGLSNAPVFGFTAFLF